MLLSKKNHRGKAKGEGTSGVIFHNPRVGSPFDKGFPLAFGVSANNTIQALRYLALEEGFQ